MTRVPQRRPELLLAVGHCRELGNVFDAERKPHAYGESSELERYPVRAVPAGLVRIERHVDAIEALELLGLLGMQAGASNRKPRDPPLSAAQSVTGSN